MKTNIYVIRTYEADRPERKYWLVAQMDTRTTGQEETQKEHTR